MFTHIHHVLILVCRITIQMEVKVILNNIVCSFFVFIINSMFKSPLFVLKHMFKSIFTLHTSGTYFLKHCYLRY